MTFEEQVITFSAAQWVVGTIGAECTNCAFAPPGVRLLGLAPATLNDDFFWDLVSHKGGAYLSLHGVAETENMNADFFVDLALLHEMLDLLDNDAT